MNKLDVHSISEEIEEVQKKLKNLPRKSRIQSLGKIHYNREEKRLSEKIRHLEWLYQYYSTKPKESSGKEEAKSVITEDPSDTSDSEAERVIQTTQKLEGPSNSQSETYEVKPSNLRDMLAKKKKFSEILEELESHIKEAKTRIVTKNNPTVKEPKADSTPKENKIIGKRIIEATKKVEKKVEIKLHNNKSVQQSTEKKPNRDATSSKKGAQRKVEKRSESGSKDDEKSVKKQEIQTSSNVHQGPSKNINQEKQNEPKAKSKDTKHEVSSNYSNHENKTESISIKPKPAAENHFKNMSPRKISRHVSKLPENTDSSTKRMLQSQFETKLKSAQPRKPEEQKSNEQKRTKKPETSAKNKTELDKADSATLKVEKKSKFDSKIKAKVNSWNKEYMLFKAGHMTVDRSKEQQETKEESKNRKIKEKEIMNKNFNDTSLSQDTEGSEHLEAVDKKELQLDSLESQEEVERKRDDKLENRQETDEVRNVEESDGKILETSITANDGKNEINEAVRVTQKELKEILAPANILDDYPDCFIGELTPNISVDSVVERKPLVTKHGSQPGCSNEIYEQEKLLFIKENPLERKTSEIVLEKKDIVILTKDHRHNLVVKQPVVNLKEMKKSEGDDELEESKKFLSNDRGIASREPSVELVFEQRQDGKNSPLVEKLLEHRIELIEQALECEKHIEDFSKPSITYI